MLVSVLCSHSTHSWMELRQSIQFTINTWPFSRLWQLIHSINFQKSRRRGFDKRGLGHQSIGSPNLAVGDIFLDWMAIFFFFIKNYFHSEVNSDIVSPLPSLWSARAWSFLEESRNLRVFFLFLFVHKLPQKLVPDEMWERNCSKIKDRRGKEELELFISVSV